MFKFLMQHGYFEEAGAEGAAAGGGELEKKEPDGGGLLETSQVPDNWLPEKFAVKGEDGALDIAASSKKLAEGYTNLEKLVGTGEKPPKTPDEYDLKLGEGVKFDAEAFEEMKKDPEMQSFLKGAHAKGLTNEQVNYVLSEYLPRVQTVAEGAHQLDIQAAQTELKELWGKNEYSQNIGYATAAFKAFVPAKFQDRINDLRDPLLVSILASVGKEMGEDSPSPNSVTQVMAENVDDLMRSPAYFNDKHPDHKKISEQVRKHFERKFGNTPA